MAKISAYPAAAAATDTDEYVINQGGVTKKITRPKMLTGYLAPQDTESGAYTFVQTDSGREKIFDGASPASWTVPALAAGTHAVVHNLGSSNITFVASGVTIRSAGLALAPDRTCALSWTPGNVVKLTGELGSAVNQVEEISGHIETVEDKTYVLSLAAAYAAAIESLTIKTASGTCTAKVTIDGVDVTGLTGVAVSSTEATANASGANAVAVGNTVALVISANSAGADLTFSLKMTRS